MKKAPWKDFNGNDIFEGNTILHPNGDKGIVVFRGERKLLEDQWLVDYGDGHESRLCLQVGDKGQAYIPLGVVIK